MKASAPSFKLPSTKMPKAPQIKGVKGYIKANKLA